MQSLRGRTRLIRRQNINKVLDTNFSRLTHPLNTTPNFTSPDVISSPGNIKHISSFLPKLGPTTLFPSQEKYSLWPELVNSRCSGGVPVLLLRPVVSQWTAVVPTISSRCMTTMGESVPHNSSAPVPDAAPYVKFKRLDKTAGHIMQIIDKEAVEEVKGQREIPDIRPGYIIQLKVEVPENKRRVSVLKGTVIARRNAGLNTTFRLRRLVAGVGVESLFALYSPTIKEIKVLEKKKVRRAKLYYLRDKMNALKKH